VASAQVAVDERERARLQDAVPEDRVRADAAPVGAAMATDARFSVRSGSSSCGGDGSRGRSGEGEAQRRREPAREEVERARERRRPRAPGTPLVRGGPSRVARAGSSNVATTRVAPPTAASFHTVATTSIEAPATGAAGVLESAMPRSGGTVLAPPAGGPGAGGGAAGAEGVVTATGWDASPRLPAASSARTA
jgi:hypothetical protein